jgi:hypothetical protein
MQFEAIFHFKLRTHKEIKMATSTAKPDTSKVDAPPVIAATTPNPFPPALVAQFEKDPAQDDWIRLEKERTEARQDAPGNAFVRAAEQNIVFINAAALNDQWIGIRPEEELYKGQPVSTFRIVPLNGVEGLREGRKVILPSGDTMFLPAGITSPDQIVHPETGERLMAEEKKTKK